MPSILFLEGPFKGQSLAVPDDGILIGSGKSCHLQIEDADLAEEHGLLARAGNRWTISDLGTRAGIYVNGKKKRESRLKEGFVITMGDTAFEFSLKSVAATKSSNGTNGLDNGTHVKGYSTDTATAIAAAPAVQNRPLRSLDRRPEQSDLGADDIAVVKELNRAYENMQEQLGRVIVGQQDVIEQVLIAVFCRGHALLVGVPGLAKTLLVSTLSQVLDLQFKRIQFTPDLMPSDITGTDVLQEDPGTGKRTFRFMKGPIFTNMLLADEINRTPPKTQAALLEAMQEHRVTIGDHTYPLDEPFFVLATQNPIEQEGTYPLPEAQLDRFMFNIVVDYPSAEEEIEIIRQVSGTYKAAIDVALRAQDVLRLQEVVRRVPAADHVIQYASELARATRPNSPDAPDFVKEMVGWGAGPRAGIYLVVAAKAHAILNGRYHCTTEDVAAVAPPVLRHRVLTTFNAEAAGVKSDDIVRLLLEHVVPRADLGVN